MAGLLRVPGNTAERPRAGTGHSRPHICPVAREAGLCAVAAAPAQGAGSGPCGDQGLGWPSPVLARHPPLPRGSRPARRPAAPRSSRQPPREPLCVPDETGEQKYAASLSFLNDTMAVTFLTPDTVWHRQNSGKHTQAKGKNQLRLHSRGTTRRTRVRSGSRGAAGPARRRGTRCPVREPHGGLLSGPLVCCEASDP